MNRQCQWVFDSVAEVFRRTRLAISITAPLALQGGSPVQARTALRGVGSDWVLGIGRGLGEELAQGPVIVVNTDGFVKWALSWSRMFAAKTLRASMGQQGCPSVEEG